MATRYKEESRFTQDYIKSLIDYNPETGVATWKFREDARNGFNGLCAGKDITSIDARGYIQTSILDYKIALHRLIFIYMEGREPLYADHINGVRIDNRWKNLRAVTHRENCQNVKKKVGKSGYTGVKVIKKKSGVNYRSEIRVNGKQKQLGMFDTPE